MPQRSKIEFYLDHWDLQNFTTILRNFTEQFLFHGSNCNSSENRIMWADMLKVCTCMLKGYREDKLHPLEREQLLIQSIYNLINFDKTVDVAKSPRDEGREETAIDDTVLPDFGNGLVQKLYARFLRSK